MSGNNTLPDGLISAVYTALDVSDKLTISIGILYLTFLALAIFNKSYRKNLLLTFFRTNELLGRIFTSLVGVRSDENPINRINARKQYYKNIAPSAPVIRLSEEVEQSVANLFEENIRRGVSPHIKAAIKEILEDESRQIGDRTSIAYLQESAVRLRAASSTVTIRGFVNLLIGIGFAFGSLYLLREAIEIFTPQQISEATLASVIYFVGARISLALIITLIAYFFLSLYRRSLDETKFYQNELTSISALMCAIQLSWESKTLDSRDVLIGALVNIDRNAVTGPMPDLPTKIDNEILKALIDKVPALKLGA